MSVELVLKIEQVQNGFIVKKIIHNGKVEPDEQPETCVAYDVADLKAHLHEAHDQAFGKD